MKFKRRNQILMDKKRLTRESLTRPIIKIVILSVLSGILSIIVSSLEDFDCAQPFFKTKLVILVIMAVVYLFVLCLYEVFDINTRRAKAEVIKQLHAYEVFCSKIADSCKENTTNINTCIRETMKTGTINLELWNFDEACMSLCENIFDCLSVLCDNNNIEVAYVKLKEDSGGEKKIYMNSYYNGTHTSPSVYRKTRIVKGDDPNLYYDARLFACNNAEHQILKNKEEISKEFAYKNLQSRNSNSGKYNQYIAIPVFCHDEKMVGLLEVACLNGAVLGFSKEELEEIVRRYLVPSTYIILLLHKLEKALLVGTVAD